MKALSLFAGVGGFDLAAERAGITVAAHCEIDAHARAVLQRRFPNALTYTDVTELDPDDLRRAGAVPDVILGGFPCQDLSVAGRRAGLAGGRSGLFYEIVRLAAALHPRWLVLENVPGLLSSNDGRDMGAVLGALADLGYGFAYRVLDAQHFGVPQRRRRIFIVGCLGDWATPAAVLLEPESSGGDLEEGPEAGEELAGTLGGGSGSRGWAPDTDRMTFVPTTAYSLTAKNSQDRPDKSAATLVAHTLTGEGHDASEDGTGRGTPLVPVLAPTLTASWGQNNGQPGNGGKDEAVLAFMWQAGGNNSASGAFDYDLTPTLPKSQTVAVQTELAVRRLTPTECERLQGFPDGWTEGQADSHRYRQMGNAVAVPCVEWILRRLVAVEAREVAA